jgi:arylsulfatase A-like enzyme
VRYTDAHVGWLLDSLAELGVLDETTVVVSSDHGENLGELGIYCDHQTADLITHRVPAVVRGPGIPGGQVDEQLRYQLDLSATLVELAGGTVPAGWDGRSFCGELIGDGQTGERRDHLVLSCGAWATQRAVRFDDWLSIRTHHDAFHGFPTTMLFDVARDPHEQHDVADAHPDVVGRAAQLLLDWESAAMERSPSPVDPLATVLREGGGYYTRGQLDRYLQRLVATGRDEWAARLATSMTTPSMAAPSIASPAADGVLDWAAAPTD